jgi:hypothetical protein
LLIEAKRLTGEVRRDEEGFWTECAEEEPLLPGAVFDAMSEALGADDETSVPTKLRLADAARWAEAAARFELTTSAFGGQWSDPSIDTPSGQT